MRYLHINNTELTVCIERAKAKMTKIEEKHSKNLVLSLDVINRVGLCIYDSIHSYIDQREAFCGDHCPDCNDGTMLVKKEATLFDGVDDIEVCAYKCTKCGYVVYG